MRGRIRRRLVSLSRTAHRDDLAALLDHPPEERAQHAKAVALAIDALRTSRAPEPRIADDIAQWFAPRAVRVLQAYGINTLADLTVRIPRRRQWWKVVPGLGAVSARAIEAFFAACPALTEKARALIVSSRHSPIVPWESISLPHEVDGSESTFRAAAATCTLDATHDYQAARAAAVRGSDTFRRRCPTPRQDTGARSARAEFPPTSDE
nr:MULTISPECIES: phage integrase family protein [unclassified Paraburkholderia]